MPSVLLTKYRAMAHMAHIDKGTKETFRHSGGIDSDSYYRLFTNRPDIVCHRETRHIGKSREFKPGLIGSALTS